MMTTVGVELPGEMVRDYLSVLVNQFFKILPLKENEETTLHSFMLCLQRELLGAKNIIEALSNDSMWLCLISILQYHIDNECELSIVRQDVFKAISLCKKLQNKYGKEA